MFTYPATPVPSLSYQTNSAFKTLLSGFDSGAETRRKLIRFPKREYSIAYKNLIAGERNLLHAFYRNVGGMSDSFWFVDWVSRVWTDEYVGRGGPLNLIGAIYDDGGVLTNQTVACVNATANAMTLLPAAPATDDAYYFISNSQFDKLTLTIGTPGVGTWTIAWEFWNGSAWTAVSGLSDGTTGFTAAAGARDVTWTIPSTWAITSVAGITGYAVRARVSAFTSITTRPLGSGCVSNSKTYDLHGVGCSSVSIYVDGVLKTGGGTDYTFVSGGGGAGADRITFVGYPSVGTLITSDFTGYLCLKARLGDDAFNEEMPFLSIYNVGLKAIEVQW